MNLKANGNIESSPADAVLSEWRKSAFYWQKHHGAIQTMFQPVTQALIDAAGIVQGHSVLDVAGGSGEPSITIAETVGPTGSVTCTDAIKEMVAAAEAEAQHRGLTNIKFQQCVADSLPFADRSFDAVVCRMGAMFFPDPVAALREMMRVTKDDGVISLVVWGKSELNPFFTAITEVVDRHFDPQSNDPNASSAFRFAELGVLSGLLKSVGAVDVSESEFKFYIAAAISPREFWEIRSETSGTLREKLGSLSQQERSLIAEETLDAVREFFPNNQLSLPAQMILVSGKKP